MMDLFLLSIHKKLDFFYVCDRTSEYTQNETVLIFFKVKDFLFLFSANTIVEETYLFDLLLPTAMLKWILSNDQLDKKDKKLKISHLNGTAN